MISSSKTFAHGTLEASTDSWLLAAEHVVTLDVSALDSFDASLEHKVISVIGTTEIPKSSLQRKLIVEKLVAHEVIRQRAYAMYESGQGGSAADHWLRAERELLSV